MDRARTEGALNHLGLFAFNWTRPRTNLSPKREQPARTRKGGRVRDLSMPCILAFPQIQHHDTFAKE